MVLVLIANISLAAVVLATVVIMLVRAIITPVSRHAVVTGARTPAATHPGPSHSSGAARARAPRRLDAGLSMER